MRKIERKILYCPVCKKEFIQKYTSRTEKYCSKNCWSKRNPPKNICCDFCGKEFEIWQSNKRKKFCSKACYSLYQEKLIGNKSHLWKGGKTKFHKLERTRAKYLKWRDFIFERDGYSCQECGEKSGNGHRVILNAHHIKQFSQNETKRFDIDNGITLCKKCHTLKHPHLIKQIAVKRLAQKVLPF
jgi:5-methylcytosine-specific restriction endonuclease McrA